jgi:hypothetical protein
MPPPEGQEYVAIGRPRGGDPKVVGRLIADELGQAFLVAKELPEGTTAVDLAWSATGKDRTDDATVRVAARYPATRDERGVLLQQVSQARKGKQ